MKLLTWAQARQAILSGFAVIILEIETRERLTDSASLADLREIEQENRQDEVRFYGNV